MDGIVTVLVPGNTAVCTSIVGVSIGTKRVSGVVWVYSSVASSRTSRADLRKMTFGNPFWAAYVNVLDVVLGHGGAQEGSNDKKAKHFKGLYKSCNKIKWLKGCIDLLRGRIFILF